MKATYIICTCVYQLTVLVGSALIVLDGGSAWWLAGGIILCLMSGSGLAKRMDDWSGK